jgi:hypothetical protein
MPTTIINDDPNDNPSFNAGSVARFEDCSVSTLNRRIREGRFPPPDFRHGPYRYWLRSTVVAARARRITEFTEEAQQRKAQLDAAANARAAQKRKRAAAATSPDAV